MLGFLVAVHDHDHERKLDKVLFGSDNPVILPDRWLAEFDKLPSNPEVKPLIIKENAARLLKLR